jgi:hypothetical protein
LPGGGWLYPSGVLHDNTHDPWDTLLRTGIWMGSRAEDRWTNGVIPSVLTRNPAGAWKDFHFADGSANGTGFDALAKFLTSTFGMTMDDFRQSRDIRDKP